MPMLHSLVCLFHPPLLCNRWWSIFQSNIIRVWQQVLLGQSCQRWHFGISLMSGLMSRIIFWLRKCFWALPMYAPPAPNNRIPVSPLLLCSIWRVLPLVLGSQYEVVVYQSVFSLAFFAFLSVGEYTSSRHALRLSDIMFVSKAVKISFSSYKF